MASFAGRRWLLASCLASYFLTIVLIYQMSPFFQPYASTCCGATPDIVGVIFSVLPLSSFVGALVMADFLGRLGARTSLAGGLLALAGCTLGFGLSNSVISWLWWRCCQGVASAAVTTSISTAAAQTFSGPNEFAFVNSLLEMAANMGFSVGPFLGATFYQWGGFLTPFAVSATGHVLVVMLSSYVWPRPAVRMEEPLLEGQNSEPHLDSIVTWREVASKGEIWLAGVAALSIGSWGCIEPTLAVHFTASLDITTGTQMGLLFAVPALFSVAAAAVTPPLMERFGGVAVSVSGQLVLALGCALLGLTDPTAGFNVPQPSGPPAPLGIPIGHPIMWVTAYGGMILVNIGYALGWTPILPLMMDLAAVQIANEKRDAANAVSAIFQAAACAGSACGPIIGGFMSDLHGFAGTSLTPAAVCLLYAGAFLVHAPRLNRRPRVLSGASLHAPLEHGMGPGYPCQAFSPVSVRSISAHSIVRSLSAYSSGSPRDRMSQRLSLDGGGAQGGLQEEAAAEGQHC